MGIVRKVDHARERVLHQQPSLAPLGIGTTGIGTEVDIGGMDDSQRSAVRHSACSRVAGRGRGSAGG